MRSRFVPVFLKFGYKKEGTEMRSAVVILTLVSVALFGVDLFQIFVAHGMSEVNARLVAEALLEEHEKDPSVRLDFMVALLYTESTFRNVLGDDGKSVGYFQLTKAAVLYVARFHKDVAEFYRKLKDHKELLRFPGWQARIAYRYLSLWLKEHKGDYVSAMDHWNGEGYFYVVHRKWTELFGMARVASM